jgi:acyl-CoA synthetase (AMP-forming)/AMP-acid ligase II
VVAPEQSKTLSYAELSRMAKDLAADFQRHGLRPGDRVAILLPTSIEFATAFFAASAAGAVVAPLDIYMKRTELLGLLDVLKPWGLVTNPSLHRKLGVDNHSANVCLLELRDSLAASFPDSNGSRGGGKAGVDESGLFQEWRAPEVAPEEDAVLILSSGSTGLPKAVRLSHQAILRNIGMHLESLDIAENIRGLQVLPMNYSYGLIASFLSILYSHGTAVMMPTPQPGSVVAAVAQYDVNLVMGTPAIFQYVIEKAPTDLDFRRSPVRYVTLGGDRCRRYALNLVSNRLPSARPYITYGLTEAGPRVSTLPHRFVKKFPESVGLPLRGVEISILDERGRRRAPREAGEIVIKTPSLMNGYFGDPARTKSVIRNGLCHTGDIGYLDQRGFLYYLGRKDRQFKFGGRMVNPSVIEQCIASHPCVREVTVEKSESAQGERIRARVKTRGAPRESFPEELRRFCRRRVASCFVPSEFHFEHEDNYYHKGKVFRPVKEEVPDQATDKPGGARLPAKEQRA